MVAPSCGSKSVVLFSFLPRCIYAYPCRTILAMCEMSVCLSVCQSVKRVNCEKKKETHVKISIPYKSSFKSAYPVFVFLTFLRPYTTHHSSLITRLSSWFGFDGSILNWFKSYLSSRPFLVKCNSSLSSSRIFSCGVPRDSVLGALLFIMYTTPLNTLISSFSVYKPSHMLTIHNFSLLLPI